MSKKPGAKQVSIAAFFSPKPAAKSGDAEVEQKAAPSPARRPPSPPLTAESPAPINADAFTTPSPAPAAGKRKRPARAAGSSAKKKLLAAAADEEDEAGEGVVDLTTPTESATKTKRSRKTPTAAKAKPKAKKADANKPKAKPVVLRGVSPHERTGDDDDDDLDDDDDDDDAAMDVEMTGTTPDSAPVSEKVETGEQTDDDVVVVAEPPPPATPAKAKASRKAASTTSSTTTTPKAKPAPKKQKESVSAAPAISPAESPQKAPPAPLPEPVDPVVRARIASYKQKVDELTQLCERLMSHSQAKDDATLMEIYGLGLDLDLDAGTDDEQAGIRDAWRTLTKNLSTAPAAATAELPTEVKHFVARAIQSRSDGLSALVKRISTALGDASESTVSTLALEMEIKMLAQRTAYGARPAKANLYEDATAEALWCWEVNNIELHFSDDAQKTIKRLRKQRKRTGTQFKSLSRVVQLLHQSPIDEAKVGNEEAKIGKFVSQVEAELLKAREREKRDEEKTRKEQEKAHALEEKKRLEHEKLQAKEDEKRKKEEEAEAAEKRAQKQRNAMTSFLRPVDGATVTTTAAASSSAAAPGNVASAADSSVAISGVKGGRITGAEQLERMASMDREVPYLVKDTASGASATTPTASRSGAALLQRQRDLVTARVGHWNTRRYRDAKLGIMKLLQFHENYRPAYHGTFSKRSVVFRRGRRPLAQYAKFDYSVDSEEEWEEEEPGESLSDADSDVDGEDDEDQLDYGDDWLAYEDEVEYVDGEEHRDDEDVVMEDDAEGDDEGSSHQSAAASRKRRRRRVAAENKKQKLTKLEPQLNGPFVCCDIDCDDHLSRYAGELLEDTPEFVSPLMKRAQAREEAAAAAAVAASAAAAAAEANGAGDAGAGSTTPAKVSTPVVRKKTKTATASKPTDTTATTEATTPHKPPVKRKITAQLQSAGETPSSVAAASTVVHAPTVTKKKKAADKTATNGTTTAEAVPRVAPAKSALTGWLKASSSTATTPATEAASSSSSSVDTATTSDAPPSAPVEI